MNLVQSQAAYDTGLEARFAAAARHSRMVRILRVAVPVAVLLSMSAEARRAVGADVTAARRALAATATAEQRGALGETAQRIATVLVSSYT